MNMNLKYVWAQKHCLNFLGKLGRNGLLSCFSSFLVQNSCLHLKKKISICPLRNDLCLFWVSWWSGIFAAEGKGDHEDECTTDASLLLSVITLAERDNYSFRSFKVSWASYGDAFADYLCDSLWIFWILPGGFN